MAERRVIVYPPLETGGRRVRVDGEILGTAYSQQELAFFLQNQGIVDRDEWSVRTCDLIEWRGGGPDEWEH
ncbi:hypothetical protein [Streptomyces chiangmaiensis]|uniref:Uncharacterized protein n=1 Tax=Streptomyces chiangmaiensis TaxID=766497 RepID=A0ABU7FGL6_9ACTN|nr:hypothetical protein [Streptomyces chiangmaiensis]MED7823075.1 hypothetical protein [Streptomyces chiangmaiensis]